MLKLLQRYNGPILVVGGCLLMVVFLFPQFAGSGLLGGPGEQVVGRYRGGTITEKQRHRATRELQTLAELFRGVDVFGVLQLDGAAYDPGRGPEHWILLAEQAKNMGVVGGPQTARGFYNILGGPRDFQDLNPWQVGVLAKAAGVFAMGMRCAEVQFAFTGDRDDAGKGVAYSKVSDLEILGLMQQYFSQAQLRYAVVNANAAVALVDEPAEEKVRAHFEANKDVPAQDGGYRLPDGVKFEWVVVRYRSIYDAVDVDPIEVRERYDADKGPGAAYKGDFQTERARVENDIRTEAAADVLRVVQAAAKRTLNAATRGLEKDHAGLYVLPEDWKQRRPTMQSLADSIVDAVKDSEGIEITAAVRGRTARWETRDAVRGEIAGISRASFRMGRENVFFADTVFTAPAFIPEGMARNPAFPPVQQGVTCGRVLKDPGGSLYYFRVVDTRQSRAPEALENVRDRVARDLRRNAAFEKLLADDGAYLRDLVERAGLQGVEQDFLTEQKDAVLSRFGFFGGQDGSDVLGPDPRLRPEDTAGFRGAVMDLAERVIDPAADPSRLPVAERTVVAPIEGTSLVAVGVVLGRRPLLHDLVDEYATRVGAEIAGVEHGVLRDTRVWPFSWARIAGRVAYEAVQTDEDQEQQPAAQAAAE